jgi:signal transduction histidine kinase
MQSGTPNAEEILKEAFKRFDESSLKLQERYEDLLKETEGLRLQIREKDQEIKRNEKLAMLGETAAALAHEVRNPLGSIKIFVSMLRKDLRENADAQGLIENINQSISALDNVVCNILRFSKNENLDSSVLNLHSLIQEQTEHYRILDNHNLNFVLKLQANPYILGNEHALRQVFHNLFLNAAQAMKNKGVISVETAEEEQGIVITVSDDGPGIEEKIKDKIFDPFVTNKNEGTGLGLAVVSQVIRLHKGRITAENAVQELGRGAKFSIHLPRIKKLRERENE